MGFWRRSSKNVAKAAELEVFWDSSAIVPLVVREARSPVLIGLASSTDSMVAWWGSQLECWSAISRLRREGRLEEEPAHRALDRLETLAASWAEVLPEPAVRRVAQLLLLRHPLRAADSLQLAAALTWADLRPDGHSFCALDERLRQAARGEGFRVVPDLAASIT